ncbi:MAG TPA: FCD domain-containing protein [Candidatus Fournierella excrementavium]|nr:FCD domain-containing protein [Candidatus Fournierella excrementavium]
MANTHTTSSLIARKTLHEQVADAIIQKIRINEWTPGMKLPSEQELVETFGVNRHAIREALRSLEQISILETKNGQGTFVCTQAPRTFTKQMSSLLLIDKVSLDELYAFRRRMEPMLVTWAIENLNDNKIEALRRWVDEGDDAAARADAERFAHANVEFHIAIAQATDNRLAETFYGTLRELIYLSYAYMDGDKQVLVASSADHRRIFDAMVARDIQAAVDALNDHLSMITTLFA